jgi:phosphopantetheine--protein transferase-like protein|tara:strand:+ start:259 stop:615 length:357 start_codon:yes stop_codon:yes gene_type:complete
MENKLSVGVDIISIERIRGILTSSRRNRFLSKIFSSKEIDDASSRPNEAQFFAGRFAAKEAFKKASSNECFSQSHSFKSIEVFNHKSGKPGIKDLNYQNIELSISHDGNYAIAFCVLS